MKLIIKILVLVGVAATLASCGDSEPDHSEMDHSTMAGDAGHSTGKIISISPDGRNITINHQEIEAVGMGAMTMEFGTLATVDLSKFAAQQNVSFMVKKSRDGSYRITALCNTDLHGAKCLDAIMKHNAH